MSNEPKAGRKIKVERLERAEEEMTPEQAERARGGMADGSVRFADDSVRFVTGANSTSSKVTDGTSNT